MFKPARARHRVVMDALAALDGGFLGRAECFFGGGTRIVLALGEYRESADIDFLCASREGYRALRTTVGERTLGAIARAKLDFAREVIADRYGIRTVLDVAGERLKLEIILEARIGLSGTRAEDLPVPVLDPASCCAEKFLANADRGGDASVLGRDVIDLAFMASGWGREPLRAGLAIATEAYGKVVAADAKRAATGMLERTDWRRRCVAALSVTNARTLLSGLRLIAAGRW
jgi:nucleotidyltransferase AbiEii toxin of type IV toxin-antitoxin system